MILGARRIYLYHVTENAIQYGNFGQSHRNEKGLPITLLIPSGALLLLANSTELAVNPAHLVYFILI